MGLHKNASFLFIVKRGTLAQMLLVPIRVDNWLLRGRWKAF